MISGYRLHKLYKGNTHLPDVVVQIYSEMDLS